MEESQGSTNAVLDETRSMREALEQAEPLSAFKREQLVVTSGKL